jgi:hypothetical protein
VTERPRPQRAEPREVAELKHLRTAQPELASAVDMQLALVEMQRRVQARVPLPWIQADPEWVRTRQTADILHRYEAIERADYQKIVALGREGNALEPLVKNWYDSTSGVEGKSDSQKRTGGDAPASLDQVLVLALRPFLARCAEALTQRTDLSKWTHGHCPFCGWEPDFAVITPVADRRLICGRCLGQWAFPSLACPFCSNDERSLITSFATKDGRYRVYACDVCRRYLKAYDTRHATRPVMVAVDSIATLPLDAAAMQRGYVG